MIIYIDSDFKCHITNDGTMKKVETEFFDGKCDAFIEGYRLLPAGEKWIREDGVAFEGEMIAPWKDYAILEAVQTEYEKNQTEMADMQAALTEANTTIAELDTALLETTYQNIIGGIE